MFTGDNVVTWVIFLFKRWTAFFHDEKSSAIPQFGTHVLTYCGLVMPYGGKDLGKTLAQIWLVTWWHRVITWTNVNLLSNVFCGICPIAINLKHMLGHYIFKITTKTSRSQWNNWYNCNKKACIYLIFHIYSSLSLALSWLNWKYCVYEPINMLGVFFWWSLGPNNSMCILCCLSL